MALQGNHNIIEVEYVIVATLACAFFCGVILLFAFVNQKKMHKNAMEMLNLKQKSQKDLFEAIGTTEIIEREKIAKNLHDDVGMGLNLIKQNLSRQKKTLQTETLGYDLNANSIDLLNTTLEKLYTSVFGLVPKHMLDFGLVRSLQRDLEIINKTTTIETNFLCKPDFEFESVFKKRALLEINRIVTELLNNVLKHASCSKISVEILPSNSKIELLLRHNGKKLSNIEIQDLTNSSSGLGLKSIEARCLILNASIDYGIENDNALIKFVIPF